MNETQRKQLQLQVESSLDSLFGKSSHDVQYEQLNEKQHKTLKKGHGTPAKHHCSISNICLWCFECPDCFTPIVIWQLRKPENNPVSLLARGLLLMFHSGLCFALFSFLCVRSLLVAQERFVVRGKIYPFTTLNLQVKKNYTHLGDLNSMPRDSLLPDKTCAHQHR